MSFPRRQFLRLTAAAAVLPTMSHVGWAQGYPTRQVRVIVPFAPGGPPDTDGAPDRGEALGKPGQAVLRREPSRRQRQHRHRPGRAGDGGRLYGAHHRQQHRHQSAAVREGPLRPLQGLRSGDAGGQLLVRARGQSLHRGEDGQRACRISSRPIPASTATPHRASARRHICSANSSAWRSASTSCTCPTPAADRRRLPSSPATRRSASSASPPPASSPATASCACSRS